MIPKPNYKPLPTFEAWLESTRFGNLGSDVSLPDSIELRGWWFNALGIASIKGRASLEAGDMVPVPPGDYTLGLILIVSTRATCDKDKPDS
jgi:hypothetical protein